MPRWRRAGSSKRMSRTSRSLILASRAAAAAELAALEPEERFLLAAYYLDHRTLAEIAKLQRVHESTISRKLERVTAGLRKRIRKRMIQAGMSPRQADEAMQDVDVRDLRVKVERNFEARNARRQRSIKRRVRTRDEPGTSKTVTGCARQTNGGRRSSFA